MAREPGARGPRASAASGQPGAPVAQSADAELAAACDHSGHRRADRRAPAQQLAVGTDPAVSRYRRHHLPVRTSFSGPAGIRLTKAQKAQARQRSSLERKGYRAMHCLAIPDSNEQIDHLVIGRQACSPSTPRTGTSGCRYGRAATASCGTGRTTCGTGSRTRSGRLIEAAGLLSGELGSGVAVRPAMAVYGRRSPGTRPPSGTSTCSAAAAAQVPAPPGPAP